MGKSVIRCIIFIISLVFVFADLEAGQQNLPPKSSNGGSTQTSSSPKSSSGTAPSSSVPSKSDPQTAQLPKIPILSFNAKKRVKTIKDDHIKVRSYHLGPALAGALPPNSVNELYTPEIETEAYFGYPLTLDYVVDIYIESTDGTTSAYGVIADTGSSNLAVAVADCTNCGTGSTDLDVDYYDPEMCIEVTYGSGDWTGLMTAATSVSMVDDSTYAITPYFAAITDGDEFFTSSGYVGILGLGYSGICSDYTTCSTTSTSTIDATPYTDDLTTAGIIEDNIFTIGFCDLTATMAFGGIDSSQYTGDITYVDTQKIYEKYYGYFLVKITGISIDGVAVSDVSTMNTIGGTLIDSGTTLLYVSTTIYKVIKAKVEASLTSLTSSFFDWEDCIEESDLSSLPSITFSIGTYDLVLSPYDYLLYYDDCYYWGISTSSVPIIGNIALQDVLVVFDKENNQVGFAEANCDAVSDKETKTKPKPNGKGQSTTQSTSQSPPQSSSQSPPQANTSLMAISSNSIPKNSIFGFFLVASVVAGISYYRSTKRNGYTQIPTTYDI